MFDEKCLDLAKAFLEDHPHIDKAKWARRLAQAIQDAIEIEIEIIEEEAEAP